MNSSWISDTAHTASVSTREALIEQEEEECITLAWTAYDARRTEASGEQKISSSNICFFTYPTNETKAQTVQIITAVPPRRERFYLC